MRPDLARSGRVFFAEADRLSLDKNMLVLLIIACVVYSNTSRIALPRHTSGVAAPKI